MKIYIYIYNFWSIRILQPIKNIYFLWSGNNNNSYNLLVIKDSKIINKYKTDKMNIDILSIKYDYIVTYSSF